MPDRERKEASFAITTRGQFGRQARGFTGLVSNGWSIGGCGPNTGSNGMLDNGSLSAHRVAEGRA